MRKEFIKVGFSVCLVEYLVVVASFPCWVVSSSLSYLALFVDIIAFLFVCPLPPPQPAGLGLANITTTTPCILRSTASRRRQRSCTRHPSVPYCLIPSLLHCTALHCTNDIPFLWLVALQASKRQKKKKKKESWRGRAEGGRERRERETYQIRSAFLLSIYLSNNDMT